jgi:hypothetical protein
MSNGSVFPSVVIEHFGFARMGADVEQAMETQNSMPFCAVIPV